MKKVLESIFDYCINKYNDSSDEEKIYMSVFFNNTNNYIDNKYDIEKYDDWKKYEIVDKNMKKISLGKICDNFVTIKIIENRDIMGIEYEILDNKLIIKVRERYFYMNGSFIECFIQKINIYFKSVFLNENDEIIIEKKEQGNYMIEEKYKLFLENLRNHSYSSRFLIPCQIKYSKIRLKEKINFDKMSTCGLNSYFSVPIMLSPFVVIINKDERKEVKIRINDKLTDWVYDNRFDEKVTKEEIKNTYDDFIKEFKEIVIQ